MCANVLSISMIYPLASLKAPYFKLWLLSESNELPKKLLRILQSINYLFISNTFIAKEFANTL